MTIYKHPDEHAIERTQVEAVFGLGGGELDDQPLTATDASGREISIAYHFDGVPEYAGSDHPDHWDRDYFTVVRYGTPSEVLTTTNDDGNVQTYRLRAHYLSSGETECVHRSGAPEDALVTAEQATRSPVLESLRAFCPYCEADGGEAHGYIYLGDGWGEAIYRRDRTPAELAEKHNIEVWEDDVWTLQCEKCGEVGAHGGHIDANGMTCPECNADCEGSHDDERGWFYWTCAPGCLPEGDASGPYETETAALEQATEGLDDDSEGDRK